MQVQRHLAPRWLASFVGFPIGGLVANLATGPLDDPLVAGLAGTVAGAAVGSAQWLAGRSYGLDARWPVYTAVGMGVGVTASTWLTGTSTATGHLVLMGLIVGAFIGAAQSLLLRRRTPDAIAWTAVVAGTWGLGWLVTSSTGVHVENGYVVFGASGALTATLLTGLALSRLLRGSAAQATA